MAQLVINVGTGENSGDGDTLRAALVKANTNFSELYTDSVVSSNLTFSGSTVASESNQDIIFNPNGTGRVNFHNSYQFPSADGDTNQVLMTDGSGTISFQDASVSATSTTVALSATNSTDANMFLTFTDSATGNEQVRTDTGLRYNPSSGAITATSFTSDGAQGITIRDNLISTASSNADIQILPHGLGKVVFQNISIDGELGIITTDSSNQDLTLTPNGTGKVVISSLDVDVLTSADSSAIQIDDALNVSGTITGTLAGNVTGNADSATVGTNVTVSANNSTNETTFLTFVDGATGTQGIETDTSLTYNPSTNTLSAGTLILSGDLQVLGTQAIIETTTTEIEDNLFALNSKNSGGADLDAGMHINRGSAGNNAIFYWNEGDDIFKAVLSNSTSTATSVTDSSGATIVANVETHGSNAITIADNSISTASSNADINITPHGTGKVVIESLDVNQVSSSDSSAIQINDGVNVAGTVTATAFVGDGSGLSGTITVASSANNRVITDTGSAGSINAEANLTFDGSTLAVTGAITSTTSVTAQIVDTSILKSTDSSAIQVQDALNVSGAVTSAGGFVGDVTGNASTATKLASARNITITGDVDASATAFDGTGNITLATTLDTVNSNVGSFGSTTAVPVITVNAKGLVTAVSTASISTVLAISDGSTNDNVTIGTDTLTFNNVSNETTVVVSDNAVTIGLPDTITANTTAKGSNAISIADNLIKTSGSNADIQIEPHGTGNINLTAGADVVIPANIGLTFGTGEKIEGDNTDITVTSGGAIKLTATTDVVVPANVGITFGTGEKIEGDNTNLTVTSGADINLTATGDVNLPNSVGLVFGDDGEKIEGDGTNLTIASSGTLNVNNTGLMSVSGALQVSGNLTVLGTQSILETTTTEIEDGLIAINSKNSGGADIDSGIHINRGSAGNNAVFYWNEGDDKFKAVLSNSASTVTSVTDSSTATIVATFEGNITGAVTGNADTATALATARSIGGTSFDGTGDIIPGTINITANNSADETVFPAFVDGATGTQGLETDTGLTYNPSSGLLTSNAFTSTTSVTAASFVTTGNAITIADNEITTGSSNADINITPNGTGTVQTGPLTSSGAVVGTSFTTTGNAITIADNEITTGSSNADIVIDTHGTGDINLTAGADVNIPANIGLTFGNDGEKIEGDGTHLIVASSGNLTLDAEGDVIIDANDQDIIFKDAGTEFGRFTNSSNELLIKSGTSSTTALTFSGGEITLGAKLTTAGSNRMEIFDNEIKTVASNANIEITPHGTGKVVLDRIQIDDNTIQTTESNANLELIPNGTGEIELQTDTIQMFANTGFRTREYIMHGTTTNATETEIFVGGVSDARIPVPTDSTMTFTADITTRRTDSDGTGAGYHLKGVLDNNGGTVADVGDLYEIIIAEDNAGLAVDATADNTNNSLKITVTGIGSQNYSWVAVVKTYEVIE